jgi:hypothetical protein
LCCKNIYLVFQLYQDQVQLLLDAFKNPPQTREEGIYFDDRQFKCVRADKTSIYGKCVRVFFQYFLKIKLASVRMG